MKIRSNITEQSHSFLESSKVYQLWIENCGWEKTLGFDETSQRAERSVARGQVKQIPVFSWAQGISMTLYVSLTQNLLHLRVKRQAN